METNTTIEILKQAILLETKGKAFYANAADNSKDPDVKKIFRIMTDEEDDHIKYLEDQFRSYRDEGRFEFSEQPETKGYSIVDQVITKNITERISAVGFEAAAISLAIDMENRAIAAYSERAANADGPDEKAFYEWLADWERGHHKILFQLDQELKEKIWTDNNFWAF
jgi:rubrerythrin